MFVCPCTYRINFDLFSLGTSSWLSPSYWPNFSFIYVWLWKTWKTYFFFVSSFIFLKLGMDKEKERSSGLLWTISSRFLFFLLKTKSENLFQKFFHVKSRSELYLGVCRLIKVGALDRRRVVHGGQGWRLVSAIWLHAGLIHMFVNLLSIIFIGIRLEQQFGFRTSSAYSLPFIEFHLSSLYPVFQHTLCCWEVALSIRMFI